MRSVRGRNAFDFNQKFRIGESADVKQSVRRPDIL
jgi:hypothetical protein